MATYATQHDLRSAVRDQFVGGDPTQYDLADRIADDLWREGVRTSEQLDDSDWLGRIDREVRADDLCAELVRHDDGTGTLGIVVRQALADDPRATAEDVAAILREAEADARVEREREAEAQRQERR